MSKVAASDARLRARRMADGAGSWELGETDTAFDS
jgi:hypothetical protein